MWLVNPYFYERQSGTQCKKPFVYTSFQVRETSDRNYSVKKTDLSGNILNPNSSSPKLMNSDFLKYDVKVKITMILELDR